MELNCVRSPRDLPTIQRLKCLGGNIAVKAFPKRAEIIDRQPWVPGLSRLDRLIRNGLLYRALRDADHEKLGKYLTHFWSGSEGKAFHGDFRARFDEVFLAHHVRAVEALTRISSEARLEMTRLYEIGCGSGQVLDYLSGRLDGIEEFVGVDVSDEQMVENRETFAGNPALKFVCADAAEWIAENARPQGVFLTNGGVFELFPERVLKRLFRHIATALKPSAIVAIETIGNDHDLDSEVDTIVFGPPFGFSHNYPQLLREAGFSIEYREERIADDQNRWILLVAVIR